MTLLHMLCLRQSLRSCTQAVANSSVFMGVHGAGLTYLLALPPWGVSVELQPYKFDPSALYYHVFGNWAAAAGRTHLVWHNTNPWHSSAGVPRLHCGMLLHVRCGSSVAASDGASGFRLLLLHTVRNRIQRAVARRRRLGNAAPCLASLSAAPGVAKVDDYKSHVRIFSLCAFASCRAHLASARHAVFTPTLLVLSTTS